MGKLCFHFQGGKERGSFDINIYEQNKKQKNCLSFFRMPFFFCPLASFAFIEPFLLLHPRGFVTSFLPVQFSFSIPWLPPWSVALWASSLHNIPSFSSIFCHPVQLMLLLMTWNEFSCVNCEAPQGKGWCWEQWSHLAGHSNRSGKQLEAEHVLTSRLIRHIFLGVVVGEGMCDPVDRA